MKIYLLKIWNYDPSSFDLNKFECSVYKYKDLAEGEIKKHNYQITFENDDVPAGVEGQDGWGMIDYANYGYEIEELEIGEG